MARVFEVDRGGDRTLYGCLRADGRRRALASWFSCDCSIGDDPAPGVELHAGRFVALTQYPSCGPFPCETRTTYELRDLRSGRRVDAGGDVWQVVTGPGFFAYEDGRVVIVRGGREQVVDPGPGIELFSLAVAGTRLYWMRDGAPYSVADGGEVEPVRRRGRARPPSAGGRSAAARSRARCAARRRPRASSRPARGSCGA